MEILQLHHVSLPTTDLERSRQFYRDVLGLEEIQRPPFPFPGAWFRLGDRELHLIAGENVDAQGGTGTDANQLHFAIRVPSYRQRARASAWAMAIARMSPGPTRCICWRGRGPLTGYPQLYVTDPDRHLIEINAERLNS